MRKKRRTFLIIATIILFISIGFAVLSSSVSINGLFNFTNNSWSIVFKNVVVDDTSVTKTAPTINQDEDTITFSAELNKPDDYYSFNVDVENNSTLDAMLGSITVTGITSQYSDYLDCIVTYSNGVTPHTNDILYKTARVTFNIKLLYKDITASQIPANTLSPTVSITINYRQANNNAVFVTDTNHWNFDYTGTPQTFTPIRNGNYKVELWGAQGGLKDNNDTVPGKGAYVSGKINLLKTDTYHVYVGQNNNIAQEPSFNGCISSTANGTPGGGATDLRMSTSTNWYDFDSLKTRVIVAAGGGASTRDHDYPSSPAGGLYGYTHAGSSGKSLKTAATQISPGRDTGSTYSPLSNGSFGIGSPTGATGGSGYFGAAGGRWIDGGGGGGSSFISGHAGCVAIAESSTENNITFKTDTNEVACNSNTSATYNSSGYNTDPKCSIHYSTKVFTDTVMIDGKGYSWTTVKASTPTGMPNKNGIGTVMGNTGNGFAKITLIS
ncbi:MAG: glycine rich domain-containing protein [Bacilli bacterium]|nr:glycine rich domain-containing protein [Bacilli bacterium]